MGRSLLIGCSVASGSSLLQQNKSYPGWSHVLLFIANQDTQSVKYRYGYDYGQLCYVWIIYYYCVEAAFVIGCAPLGEAGVGGEL